MRSKLLTVAQIVIYGQLTLLALVVWLRFRERKVLFWMFAFLLSTTLWVSLDQTLFPWLLELAGGNGILWADVTFDRGYCAVVFAAVSAGTG